MALKGANRAPQPAHADAAELSGVDSGRRTNGAMDIIKHVIDRGDHGGMLLQTLLRDQLVELALKSDHLRGGLLLSR